MENAPRSARRISWDLLRVLAVFAVVLQHFTHLGPIIHPELGEFPVKLPWMFGASALLVISAYFVCVTVRKGSAGRWWWRRVARLLPPYLAAVVITYLVLSLVVPIFNDQGHTMGQFLGGPFGDGGDAEVPPWYEPDERDLWVNLLMVQGWSPTYHWIDASYWTLPVQLIAFTLAAMLWPRKWLRGRGLPVLLWSLLIVPLALRFTLYYDTSPQWVRSLFDGLALNRVHLFAMGIAIYLWSKRRMSHLHLIALLLSALVAHDAHAYWTDLESTVAVGIAVVLICAAARGPDWRAGPLRWLARPIQWLAGISFGVYLVHQELGYVLDRLLVGEGLDPWTRLLVLVTASVLAGWLLTVAVERPVFRLLTGERRRPAIPRQPQEGRTGRVPVSAVPSARPVSHASTSAPVPPTEAESPSFARSHTR
ncbi:peptidoglycan/LPS O-acetylase OafA/YrhL [Herbihabitans rhizosphaerae]|uniref:Peptidoglycan/LPS O-acetylase OafA/YrhL n=2 Tax=Herbihabitans rhizosphaerae TaxID=1872711 RepID=A0A4Q7L2I2_9PSEU|nr:peptidoglycan/LPS O-acetylase OafA/YrhL [Herbihabitans rhizosphaerae]